MAIPRLSNVALLLASSGPSLAAAILKSSSAASAAVRAPTAGALDVDRALLGARKPKVKVKDARKVVDSITRYGDDNETEKEGDEDSGVFRKYNPFADNHVQRDRFDCGTTYKVSSKNYGEDRCPKACPFFVQDKTDDQWCSFACVVEEECSKYNPDANIADEELGICRACTVDHCSECDGSVGYDRCKKCLPWYYLDEDGLCTFLYSKTLAVLGCVVFVFLLLIAAWVIDMAWRPISNARELKRAEVARAREKIRMDPDDNGNRRLYPFGTNLHKVGLAGPGMILHFNFQAALIAWAILVACGWMILCKFVDDDLWSLGTRKYGTPRQNCILVAWGYETQHRLLWAKVAFLWIVYAATFVLCLVYCVMQLRIWQDYDAQTTTMKDFAAMLVGVEGIPACRRLEEELKEGVQQATGQRVIGVSVGWNHAEDLEEVQKALRKDLEDLFVANSVEESPMADIPEYNTTRRMLYKAEQAVFGLPAPDEVVDLPTDENITQLVMKMHSSPRAVVVFDTEDARDTAVEKAQAEGGIQIPGIGYVRLEEIVAEPDSVVWENFGRDEDHLKVGRIVTGFVFIGLACMFWAVVFYAPYAYYVLTFDYSNGREPGFVVGFAFSMIVVIGNAIMYEVCARISDWIGYRFRDGREACYMVLYTIACMFNVALDFVTTYWLQEIVLDALMFKTYFGQPIGEVSSFSEKFKTYGMQRALAENTYTYAFPSTFLIPFLIEFIPTIFAIWYIGRLVVKNHPEVRGLDAEQWLSMVPMDMGRYADLLLNAILGIFIFFFPGGYTWSLFLAMAGSHLFIYGYDYYKVLRQIPRCDYVAYDVEWCCQAMFAPVVGIMAAALVFKSNCESGYHCVRGDLLVLVSGAAWALHTTVHILLLIYVVPMFGRTVKKHPEIVVPYWVAAEHIPSTWFSANPVNCLRSKYFYKHDPPCDYYFPGKESLMRENEKLGCHFKRLTTGFRFDLASARSAQSWSEEAKRSPA